MVGATCRNIKGIAEARVRYHIIRWNLVDTTGERWYEAELHRLQGTLWLSQSADKRPEAETCFSKALEVARAQHAQAWELRTTISLARLWQQQGKWTEAYELLASVYGWFTEGFETAD